MTTASEYKITEDKLAEIARKFDVDLAEAKSFLLTFQTFYEEVRQQHLASVMRALEAHVRKKHNKPAFRVVWTSMPKDSTNSKEAVGLKWPLKYAIALSPEVTDLRQVRNYVAHELGHLFYATECPGNINDKDLNQKMANIFGVFTMLERSEFYIEKAPKMIHANWMQVVNDFKHLGNREAGKSGIS